jgi:hypothetical protein
LELVAGMLRADVRARAGLPSDWNTVSPSLKQFYIGLIRRLAGEEFTGVPIAKLYKGIWYWPDYQTAHDFAEAVGKVPDSDMAGVKPFAYSRRPVQWLAVSIW